MSDWQLQDAKNRFSEVVKRAGDEGPQTVTVHGRRAAVVMSALEYDLLIKPRMSFNEFLMSSGYLPGAHAESCPVFLEIASCKPAWMS